MTDVLDRLRKALADRYSIEREIGSGGMATVYQAQDLKHERQVAMKVLRPELAAALGPERFLQEIKIAANLHHPHILPLYDSGVADGWYIDNVAIRELQATPLLPYPFSEDFENGLDNWSASGLDWGLVQSTVRGGIYSITDSPGGNYLDKADATLMTNGYFDLSSAVSPILTFWHKYFMEYRDYIYVEVSTDGGFNWTNELPTIGNRMYQSTWTQVMIDLSSYKTSSVRIRFRLRETETYTSDGWYIDNIEIKEQGSPQLPYPFSDDFESGLDNWTVSGLDWDLIASTVCGGQYSMTDSPDGNYLNYANAVLMTNGHFDLSAATFPVLTFWHKYWMQYRDYIYVEVSTDGGYNWTHELPTTGNQMYKSTWTQVMVDLSNYRTSPVMIKDSSRL